MQGNTRQSAAAVIDELTCQHVLITMKALQKCKAKGQNQIHIIESRFL